MARIPIYQVKIPEYSIKADKPYFDPISSKIIKCLRKHFLGERIAFRLLSSKEHPGKTVAELIKIIEELGHDRYDPTRVGDRYENIGNAKIDLFALEFEVGKKEEEEDVKWALDSFYEWPLKDQNSPIRVDIGIVYDLSRLEVVEHRYVGREHEIKRDGFIFKHPNKKPEAIKGILKIL